MRVAVAGALGRMGSLISKRVHSESDMELVCAFERDDNKNIGKDLGEILGLGKIGVRIDKSSDMDKVLEEKKPDVLVDFTSPDATPTIAETCANRGVNLVIGTTGLSTDELKRIEKLVVNNGISAVISPNMSLGMNVLFKIVKLVAEVLKDKDYDVEIIEAHHRFKKDSPSGTALKIGEIIADVFGKSLKDVEKYRGRGIFERKKGEIGFSVIRAGDIVGEHTVMFATIGERLEIRHVAHSREAFVNGVIASIKFLKNAEKGKVYNMFDVLGLRG